MGWVASPIPNLRKRPWPHTGHCPLSPLDQLFKLLLLLVLLTSLRLHVYVAECD